MPGQEPARTDPTANLWAPSEVSPPPPSATRYFRHGSDTNPLGRLWPQAPEAQGGLRSLAEVLPHPSLPPGSPTAHQLRPAGGHRITLPSTAQGAPSPNVTTGCQHQWGSKPRGASGIAPTAASLPQRAVTPALAREPRSPRTGSRRGMAGGGVRRGRGGAHMMVHRFLRRAPWNRMVVWTCLQRAQPTLFRSSLKSSRMCQLYLAEHSM